MSEESMRPGEYGQGESPFEKGEGLIASYVQSTQAAMNLIRGLAASFTGPMEMILRPFFGTQYFKPGLLIVQYFILNTWWLLSEFAKVSGHVFPSMHMHAPIGMGVVLVAFYLGCIYHALRLRPLFLNMDLERDSEVEGPELPIFRHLPKCWSWAWVRIVYEPAFVSTLAITLYVFHIAELSVCAWLFVTAIMLVINGCGMWYASWVRIRGLRDQIERSKVISEVDMGAREAPQVMAGIVLSGMNAGVDRRARSEMLRRVANVQHLPSDLEALLSKKEEVRA